MYILNTMFNGLYYEKNTNLTLRAFGKPSLLLHVSFERITEKVSPKSFFIKNIRYNLEVIISKLCPLKC
jgi:hypothetical protein